MSYSSDYQTKEIKKMRKEAFRLYKIGMSTRAISKELVKLHGFHRTHEWVRTSINELKGKRLDNN